MSAVKANFRPNAAAQQKWREAMKELASISHKTDPQGIQKLSQQSAGRFLKNVAAVTPPASGTLDSQAKAKGEQAILDDLFKLAIPVTVSGSPRAAREALASAEDLLSAHEAARRGVVGGRVNPRNRKEKLLVPQAAFNRVASELQKRVGWLAAGLNAAAERLGVHLPAWIKRHGQRFGKIDFQVTASRVHIRIVQNVNFSDDVKGYQRHWEFAYQKEIKTLLAQIKAIAQKKAQRARAHLK